MINGHRASVLQDEKALELGCTTMDVMLLNCTNGKDGKFYVFVYFATIGIF